MPALTIYSKEKSARLSYVLNWLFKERLGIDYIIVDQVPKGELCFISYGTANNNSISIPDSGLLWETSIKHQPIEIGNWNELPTIYASSDDTSVPFDIFSAIFFLLTRYEEYYNYQPDKHNRYPAIESILFKNDLLKRPIVDEWVSDFSKVLISKNIQTNKHTFQFLPTYDIDIAWSHKHKGAKRSLGALAKDVLKGNISSLQDRTQTLSGFKNDPYDSFEWLDNLHKKSNLSPIYFILCAQSTSAFDKNIPPTNPVMQELIRQLSKKYAVGIHPSYFADENKILLSEEKKVLEKIINKSTTISRQHYIKNNLPNCYRQLLSNNISDDYSMGYGTHLGFRAGVASSFLWYDLEEEKTKNLRVHPFCFMDTTAHYEEKLNAVDAMTILKRMKRTVQKNGSTLVTVFHNFSLGTDKEWKGWNEAYASFISECKL